MNKKKAYDVFQTMHERAHIIREKRLNRSALKVMSEAKRFAKANHLLIPYIYACFFITDVCRSLYETELGINNAKEMTSLLESPENARKFENDYDEDWFAYVVHDLSSCAYDNLAVHTGNRLGYNSPTVFGAIDDGFHVCRQTAKTECIQCFREYATDICMASGDYEMGEYYARINALAPQAIEQNNNQQYCGYMDLVQLYTAQGKFQAAFDTFEHLFKAADDSNNPNSSRLEAIVWAERLHLLTGRENAFPKFMSEKGFDSFPEMPNRAEDTCLYEDLLINKTIKLARHGDFLAAADLLAEHERFLFEQDVLSPWFDIRLARISLIKMAHLAGEKAELSDYLIEELHTNAVKANQWAALQTLEQLQKDDWTLNPIGIVFPIDIGPFATPGTPLSAARLNTTLSIIDNGTVCTGLHKENESFNMNESFLKSKTDSDSNNAFEQSTKKLKNILMRIESIIQANSKTNVSIESNANNASIDETKFGKEDSSDTRSSDLNKTETHLQKEFLAWQKLVVNLLAKKEKYCNIHKEKFNSEFIHNKGEKKITEKQDLTGAGRIEESYLLLEEEALDWVFSFLPENEPALTGDDFTFSGALFMEMELQDPEKIRRIWKWIESFDFLFEKEYLHLLIKSWMAGILYRKFKNNNSESDPQTVGLPSKETIADWLGQAFELNPNEVEVANLAGQICLYCDNTLAARRFYTRSFQLDRLNVQSAGSLTRLYFTAERPNDALAVVDLYLHSGGRDIDLIDLALDIAYQAKLPQEWLLYYSIFASQKAISLEIEQKRFWALMETKQFNLALNILDYIDEQLGELYCDRIFLRSYCLTQTGGDWHTLFEKGLKANFREQKEEENVLADLWNPCRALWNYIAALPNSEKDLAQFKLFLLEHALTPSICFDILDFDESVSGKLESESVLNDDEDEIVNDKDYIDEEDEKDNVKGIYSCKVIQPLRADCPAYDGWFLIPAGTQSYTTNWIVAADCKEEAMTFALEAQRQCYSIEPVPTDECELQSYMSVQRSGIGFQGKHQWSEES